MTQRSSGLSATFSPELGGEGTVEDCSYFGNEILITLPSEIRDSCAAQRATRAPAHHVGTLVGRRGIAAARPTLTDCKPRRHERESLKV
jgi:hypothetical protein